MGQTHLLSHLLTPPQKLTLRTNVSLPWDVPMKLWGWEGDGRGKGGKVGKAFPVRHLRC